MPDKRPKNTEPQERAAFAENLKELREKRGLSQSELAALAGCSNKQLNHVERGRNWPSMPIYLGLCRALRRRTPPMFGGIT